MKPLDRQETLWSDYAPVTHPAASQPGLDSLADREGHAAALERVVAPHSANRLVHLGSNLRPAGGGSSAVASAPLALTALPALVC
jgi:hypothetical protein